MAAVTNVGRSVAAKARIGLHDGGRAPVLPAFYGDNYLWLLPGESSHIVVTWPDGRVSGSPRMLADAYNAAAIAR